jgi:hypothetical protein
LSRFRFVTRLARHQHFALPDQVQKTCTALNGTDRTE